ncbi:MAG TPA: hypothetical protein VEK11_24180 [Thermoanaerobaculia bacterium]|jgi:hypothetical protein|nr:hypothetical protein [Thermoanaerobaculia bacterium]
MRRASFVLAALLLTAACGSSGGLGSLSDIILGSPSTTQSSDVRGVVTYVNQSNQSIDLDVSYINNLRNTDSNSQRGTIYFDSRTRVVYGGREYNVNDLERGDEISVRGVNNNGRYVAETIEVVRDVSG